MLKALRRMGINRAGYTLPSSPWFPMFLDVLRDMLGNPDWEPQRVAKDGCGLPTIANTVGELAQLYAGLAQVRDEDWIWEAMVREPDLVGGFNRLDTTIIKSCDGRVVVSLGPTCVVDTVYTTQQCPGLCTKLSIVV